MTTGEFSYLRRLAERFRHVGDDAAVIAGMLFAADAIVEGVDFTPETDRTLVGYHAVRVNASDIAAMGGIPQYLLVTICAPEGTDIEAIVAGVAEGARDHDCEVIGGDLSGIEGPLVVSVAIIGRVANQRAVMRSGARPGNVIYVSGPVGLAAERGYELVKAPARVALGQELNGSATAMIDVSDGLVADLLHICEASKVGAVLEVDPPEADGDDYELLFTLPAAVEAPDGSIRVGHIVEDISVRPKARGWEHRF